MKPPEIVETERLILRKPRLADAPAVFEGWARHPEVTRFLTWRPHSCVEQSEALLQKSIANWNGETNFRYLLEMLSGSFMSRPDTIVVPAGKKRFAFEIIIGPVIERLLRESGRA